METNDYKVIDSAIEALNHQIDQLRGLRSALEQKDRQIERLNELLKDRDRTIAQSTLDYKYSKALVCLQRIDDMFRNLDANIASPNFERNVYLALNEVLFSYGYRFVDYSENTQQFYECEYQPIAAPDVIFRAIGRIDNPQTGAIRPAVMGKICLPLK